MTRAQAVRFSEEWVAAWNAHDVDRVLAHYTDDFEMTSPFIVRMLDEATGTIIRKDRVREYWRQALDRMPGLRFEILEVFAGVDSVVIHYKAVLGLRACEVFQFDSEGKVSKATAHYDRDESDSP